MGVTSTGIAMHTWVLDYDQSSVPDQPGMIFGFSLK